MSAWDDMLDEFRALGGTADNIQLGQGQFGRGLFPIDPGAPIAILGPADAARVDEVDPVDDGFERSLR